MLIGFANRQKCRLNDFGGWRVTVNTPFTTINQFVWALLIATLIIFTANHAHLNIQTIRVLPCKQQGFIVKLNISE